MTQKFDPFFDYQSRGHLRGDFLQDEVGLANRNSGLPLEGLRYDVTPVGMHYLLTHFDIPDLNAATHQLSVSGLVDREMQFSIADLRRLPAQTRNVTLECAGNGRALHDKRSVSMPWRHEAVSTAAWTGTPLKGVLEQVGMRDGAVEIAFFGADRGFDKGNEHNFGRSLTLEQAESLDVLLVYEMNGQPLLPQHGLPLRLIVPGWFGMASVKWLTDIVVLDKAFDGHQQVGTYRYRQNSEDPGIPIQTLRVKSLMVPPGIPDWGTRQRLVDAGPVSLMGRAWAGGGTAIANVEVAVGGDWQVAALTPGEGRYAWSKWQFDWQAVAGEHELQCRATDADGNVQPLAPPWDNSGFGNNAVQRLTVTVR